MKIIGKPKAGAGVLQKQERSGRGKEATQFKPGVSGNPAGRKPGARSLVNKLWKYLEMTPAALNAFLGDPNGLWQRKDVPFVDLLMALYARSCVSGGKGQKERDGLIGWTDPRPRQDLDVTSGGETLGDFVTWLQERAEAVEARRREDSGKATG